MKGAALNIDRAPGGAEHFRQAHTGSESEADRHVVRGVVRDPEQFRALAPIERPALLFPCFGDGIGTADAGLVASSSCSTAD